ncbi:hypothetical protein [Methylopila sp. Yamaguchi]|uniref:hypothetical protein n=1 Tax=Methylopila sp. Yamaguchi TaxID=1437817 RepID=UPI000CBB68E7|nr:hypothetical protein [Methylopila sp. Yamaguchi]GBD50781.1 hypothetical protein METY_3994 [Methylopila sp. Yamaguchi]
MHAKPGDPALAKLKRAKALAERSGDDPEGLLAVARAAIAAREFETARAAADKLISIRPTARACLLMAELEDIENGDTGSARQWLARALRAARDPAWVADGVASDTWAPVSPVTGRLDAFVWKVPVEETRPKLAADAWLDQRPGADASMIAPSAPSSVLPRKMPELIDPADAPPPAQAAAPKPVSKVEAPKAEPAKPGLVEVVPPPKSHTPAATPVTPAPSKPLAAKPTAAVFPLSRAPDDPGPAAAEPVDAVATKRFPADRPSF